MKKIFFLSLLTTITSISINAFGQVTLGIKGALTATKFESGHGSLGSNLNETYKSRTGYAFGLYSRLGKKAFFQPELVYSNKGTKLKVIPVGQTDVLEVEIRTSYLEIPALVGFKLLNLIQLKAGPTLSFKLSDNGSLKDKLSEVTSDLDQAYKSASWGYQAGAGITLGNFDIDLRYEDSLSDISKTSFANQQKYGQKQNGWQLSLGIKIL